MRQPRVARILLLLAGAFIVYASVYPVHLHPVNGNLLSVVLTTWKARLNVMPLDDVVANFLLYAPLGFLLFFSLPARLPDAARFALAGFLGLILSTGMETFQLFESGRISSFIDVEANTAGTLAGAAAALQLNRHPKLLARPAPLLLFATWIAASVLLVFEGNFPTHPVGLVPVFIGTLAAVLLLMEWLGRTVPVGVPGVLVLAGLVWRELAPFVFSAGRQSFHWIPFETSFAASRGPALSVFIDKVFYYGAAVWFCRGLARSLPMATILIALLVAALEAAQMYIPGRTPESSDAVLTLAAGFVLYLLHNSTLKKFSEP